MSANARFVHVMSRVSPLPDWMSTHRKFKRQRRQLPNNQPREGPREDAVRAADVRRRREEHVVRYDVHATEPRVLQQDVAHIIHEKRQEDRIRRLDGRGARGPLVTSSRRAAARIWPLQARRTVG